ncbi:MAG: hypothetical protein RBU37_01780 [Myxococcota bacterium]|jgi:hypothetical protein|nr:hypothetical protein [Myxococcota bacterium]
MNAWGVRSLIFSALWLLTALLSVSCTDQVEVRSSCPQSCGSQCDAGWTCSPGGDCLCAPIDASEAIDDTPDTPPPPPYLYVRIDDVTASPTGENKGVDLDAVVLLKPSGERFYAEQVESYELGMGEVLYDEPSVILGPPDAFFEWQPDEPGCCGTNEQDFVALGQGGSIVVRMGAAMEEGDRLSVLEVGGRCQCPISGSEYYDDDLDVFVSSSALTDWVHIGGGPGGEVLSWIPALP